MNTCLPCDSVQTLQSVHLDATTSPRRWLVLVLPSSGNGLKGCMLEADTISNKLPRTTQSLVWSAGQAVSFAPFPWRFQSYMTHTCKAHLSDEKSEFWLSIMTSSNLFIRDTEASPLGILISTLPWKILGNHEYLARSVALYVCVCLYVINQTATQPHIARANYLPRPSDVGQ